MPWARRDRDADRFAGTIEFVATEARIWGPEFMGLFTLAGYARSSGRDLSTAKIRRHHFCERSGTPCFREICFSCTAQNVVTQTARSEEHTSELQSRFDLVCRLLLEKKKTSCYVILRLTKPICKLSKYDTVCKT